MIIDKIAWLIEGVIPLLIPGVLLFLTQSSDILFFISFAGSIAFAQLLPQYLSFCDLLINKKGFRNIFRLDNIIRILILISALIYTIYIVGSFLIFVWILVNLLFLNILAKLKNLGRLRYTITSIYSRILNFTFLLSHTHIVGGKSYLLYINGFTFYLI